MKFIQPKFSRRDFLKGSAALPAAASLPASVAFSTAAPAASAETPYVTDFVQIKADGRVVVVAKHLEAGQGPATGLATLVADEMDADWARVEVIFAPSDSSRYANLFFGSQGTGGSTAIANSFAQYRKAGAIARARLVAAAAQAWKTTPESIRVKNGELIFGDRRAGFGEMSAAAADMPPPLEAALKSPADFSHIGAENRSRKDIAGKLDGSARFALDVAPDNALFVVVARPPKFGAKLRSFDDSSAAQIAGYVGARAISAGVAVYGETLWAAISARRAISAQWDFSSAETRSSAQMLADYQTALDAPGVVATNTGDADVALAGAAQTVSASFSFPFLAHAPMEPLNCVIAREGDRVTLWDGCQTPGVVQSVLAAIFQLPTENISIVSLYAGGTFGRRATTGADYQSEAALALTASPQPSRPHKLVWTREDDIRGGYYRPMYAHRARAGLDADGNIVGWRHELAGKSLLIGTSFEPFAVKDGLDSSSVGGVADLAYRVPNLYVDVRNMQESPIPVLWWRSVEHTHTAFASEVMMDALAEAAGEDAVAFRLRHLGDKPRHAGVLRAVAELADWAGGAAAGRYRGVAVHESFSSYVAEIAEISLRGDAVKVEKIFCAVDCGVAVNPDIVRAQMESGIGYGLGAAMRNQITLADGGEVEQNNFPTYEPLRMKDMPAVETVIVASPQAPTGVGEPGTPPIAPALANAIYAATGKRITHLPFTAHGVQFA